LYLQFPAEDLKGGAAEIPESTSGSPTFFVAEAIAEYSTTENYFQLKKAPSADAEINIGKLTNTAKGFFTGKGGSMDKEWNNMISQVKQEGGPAVRIHRGARAREIMKNYPDRLIPSRWMHRWKDFGDDFETPLPSKEILQNDIPEHHGAKSRWILQGFHDPDITILKRSVPTPETADVPLSLQMPVSYPRDRRRPRCL